MNSHYRRHHTLQYICEGADGGVGDPQFCQTQSGGWARGVSASHLCYPTPLNHGLWWRVRLIAPTNPPLWWGVLEVVTWVYMVGVVPPRVGP